MTLRRGFLLSFAVCVLLLTAADAAHQLKTVSGLPEELSPDVKATLNPDGFSIAGEKGPVCEIWLRKEIPLAADFKPSLTIKYPFQVGELIGAIRIPSGQRFSDFRGQRVRAGVYTLRYGKQPADGNHIGTSVLSDYLVALPAADDASTQTVSDAKKLHKQSAKTTRGTHPAVFSLQQLDTPPNEPALDHDADKDHWILNATAKGTSDGKGIDLGFRLVVIGKTEAE